MSTELKDAAKRTFETLGLDIKFHRDPLRFLRTQGIRTVLDIGANRGQFAAQVRKVLPDAAIYSFEPLAEPISPTARPARCGALPFRSVSGVAGRQRAGRSRFRHARFQCDVVTIAPAHTRDSPAWFPRRPRGPRSRCRS